MASLNHPHIAQIYGQHAEDGIPCLILEYVDGETLEDGLKQGPNPVSEALELARQIADALEAAHERSIVHRYLKPDRRGRIHCGVALCKRARTPAGNAAPNHDTAGDQSRIICHFARWPKLVFEAITNGKDLLWLRRFESDAAQPLPGTDGPTLPFWSADSKSIGFFADGKLKRIDIAGGAPQVLTDAPNSPSGTWNPTGAILFALNATGPLQRVSANGGTVEPTTSLAPPRQVSHRFPRFLPDGRHFLFGASGTPEGRGVYVGSLDDKQTKRLFDADSAASLMPPDQLFVRHTICAKA